MDEGNPRKRGKNTRGSSANTPRSSSKKQTEEVSMEERLASVRRNAPVVYDSFLHHNLQWGSLSVAWGGEVDAASRTIIDPVNYPEEFNTEQTIYFAGRTDGTLDATNRTWTGSPGELFVGHVAVAKPRTVLRTSVGKFQESHRSTRVGVYKRIIHPGEVNRVRPLPLAPHIIATHAEAPIVYVWNTLLQPNRTDGNSDTGGNTSGASSTSKKKNVQTEPIKCSVPDVELGGHTGSAEFALDTKGYGSVLSGGADRLVLLWNLADTNFDNKNLLQPRSRFAGHQAPIEDCSFKPLGDSADSSDQCCSVGQDRCLFQLEDE